MKIAQATLLSMYSTECPEVLGTRLCVKCDHIQHLYSMPVLTRPPHPTPRPPKNEKNALNFREQKFHFRFRNVSLPQHILDQCYPSHMFILFLLQMNFNILSVSGTSKNSLSLYIFQ